MRAIALPVLALQLSCAAGTAFTADTGDEEAPPPDGLRAPKLVAFTPEDDLAPSASRNGRYLAFASEQNGNLDVWVRDWGTNSTYPITLDSAEDFDPAISPDAERVAFVSRRDDAKGDIFLTSIGGAGRGVDRLTDETTYDRQPVYSPDGARLYYTSAVGIGGEFITAYDLDARRAQRISPTPGFDPAPSPDGKYLAYTAPRGVGGASDPHLVAVRLTDNATRALTIGDRPEGFSRFIPGSKHALVFVRFADDDNDDGVIDAKDNASLWRIDLDLDALFAGGSIELPEPVPLTDGSTNDLFPDADGTWIYFTQGDRQQDILRLPGWGMFPEYEDPADFLKLSQTIDDPRTRWFAFRRAVAKSAPGTRTRAQALLRIGNLHLEGDRPDLAREAFQQLQSELEKTAAIGSPEGELLGIAGVELAGIDRSEGLKNAPRPIDRERVLRATQVALDELSDRFEGVPRVAARVDLELAEVLIDRGDRPRAIEAFEAVVRDHGDQPFSAAKAMLRRIELLGIAHDPDALGEAYARVLQRFPDQREAVRAAAERIVEVQLEGLARGSDWQQQVDALSRLIPRYGASPVRVAARSRLVRILRERGRLEDASLQLERLALESEADRFGAARALRELALVNEDRGRLDEALESWQQIKTNYRDLPGYDQVARDAITRVATRKAAIEEEKGDKVAARNVYASIIENDVTQVKAHRRYLALSAETGHLEQAIDEAEQRAERSPRTPMARYAYGLALTWTEPPQLDDALPEIEAALELNPQFTHAYITRGWILEMKELERPGALGTFWNTLVRSFNTAIGGIFNVEISEPDYLLQAIEDYSRARQLNPESEDPETEAEVLLDEGNASFRLGDKTNDVGNVKKAFQRYIDCLKMGYRFHSPLTELVFYERLGRAAIWSEEWAVSTMATRRAIEMAKKLGQSSRLPQLYGNLSLAYDQAGEDAHASHALEVSATQLEQKGWEARLLIARRNRAVSKLENALATPSVVESALEDLERSRRLLEEVDIEHEDLPMWRGAVDDASAAQYGFGPLAEQGVNVALAQKGHVVQGDLSRAQALRERRRQLSRDVFDAIPTYLWLFPEEPVTLLMIRERIGLDLAAAHSRLDAGDHAGAAALLDRTQQELDGWIAEKDLARDRPALLIDRARLAAIRAEMQAHRPIRDLALEDEITRGLESGFADLDLASIPADKIGTSTQTELLIREAKQKELPALAALPEALSSTTALAATATIALSHPLLDALPRANRAVRARLLYAKGLMILRSTQRQAAVGTDELGALIRSLDASMALLDLARVSFEEAAKQAAGAGFGLGSNVLALSLDASAGLSRILRDRDESVIAETVSLAQKVARANGRVDLALRFELSDLLGRGELERAQSLLESALPRSLATSTSLARSVLSRTASAALSKGEVAAALSVLDRAMLLETAFSAHPGSITSRDSEDRKFAVTYRQAQARIADLKSQLALAGASSPAEELGELRDSLETAVVKLSELRGAKISDVAKARAFAEPLAIEKVIEGLAVEEAMLIVAPIEDRLHVFFADGSTTAPAAEKLSFRKTALSPAELAADLSRLRAALERNREPDQQLIDKIRAAFLEPFAAKLAGKKTLLVGDLLAGGPLPLIDPALAVAHISSPTALALAKSEQLVGVAGTVAIAAAGEPELITADHRVTPEEAIAFRRAPQPDPAEKKSAEEGRKLEDRPPAELLEDRAQKLVIVEAPFALEPGALERSAALLASPARLPQTPLLRAPEPGEEPRDHEDEEEAWARELAGEVDRLASELPVESLDVPARVLVLARVSDRPLGNLRHPIRAGDVLRLDLILAARGYATSIIIPDFVPAAARRRILEKYLQLEERYSPAEAIAAAIREEVKTTPAAALISVIGSPGLDREGVKKYAARALKPMLSWGMELFKKGRHEAAAAALERLTRLMREAGEEKQLVPAYTVLIRALVENPAGANYARAADAQLDLVKFLESKPKTPANEKAAAQAKIDLGRLYGLAKDHQAAEDTLAAAIAELGRLEDPLGVARGWYVLGQHFERDKNDFKQAAVLIERAISIYEAEKVFGKKPPDDAIKAVRSIGAIYLNRLSDPTRAQQAFERALRYAPSEEEKNLVIISLARVARRRGDFARAADQAELARATALKNKLPHLEAEALIEAANIAWYRGDYRRGQDLCQESLDKVQSLKPELRRKRKIYALSVCGLIAMSRRELALAKDLLERARKIAELTKDESEIATQWNNLGRAYLEFGRLPDAIDAFQRALAIDEKLEDRFALAYDLRNLGTALAYQKQYDEAERTLLRGLEYAIEVQDTNNELRAHFALAELARDRGQIASARSSYAAALPIAESLDVKELAWQIHRAQGLMFAAEGKTREAELELREAVQIARSITGRSAATDFGPHRYAAFDDLIDLLLAASRTDEAFVTAGIARSLEETELLDDSRIPFSAKDVPGLLREVREARSATTAEAALAALSKKEPQLAEMLENVPPDQLARELPEDAAVIMYRVADEEVFAFVIDKSGVKAARAPASSRELGESVREYGRRLVSRADVSAANARLGALLVEPIRELVAKKKRLAIIPHRFLRYVAFPALPFGGELLVDRFVLVQALNPRGAVVALSKPLGPMDGLPIVALGGAAPMIGEVDPPLPFARKELELIREEYPRAELFTGDRATKSALLAALGDARGVLHFAGHSRLGSGDDGQNSYVDPLGGELRAADGAISLLDVLGAETKASLIVLSACSSMLARAHGAQPAQASGDELLSLAEAFHIAGAGNVLATTMHVNDIAAAMVMKRFYRAARSQNAPAALRDAQLEVRKHYPHPAWWATFVLMSR